MTSTIIPRKYSDLTQGSGAITKPRIRRYVAVVSAAALIALASVSAASATVFGPFAGSQAGTVLQCGVGQLTVKPGITYASYASGWVEWSVAIATNGSLSFSPVYRGYADHTFYQYATFPVSSGSHSVYVVYGWWTSTGWVLRGYDYAGTCYD